MKIRLINRLIKLAAASFLLSSLGACATGQRASMTDYSYVPKTSGNVQTVSTLNVQTISSLQGF